MHGNNLLPGNPFGIFLSCLQVYDISFRPRRQLREWQNRLLFFALWEKYGNTVQSGRQIRRSAQTQLRGVA